MPSPVKKLLDKNPGLTHSENMKVSSHVQRQKGKWFINTVMLEGYEVPFRFKRKKEYKKLRGARINLTYYPETEYVAGLIVEVMKVVRIKVS